MTCDTIRGQSQQLVKGAHMPETTETIREATVSAKNIGWGGDPLATVKQYLPANYDAEIRPTVYDEEEVITIFGHDNAGWTLDGYVIPRLASGMIFATEVV